MGSCDIYELSKKERLRYHLFVGIIAFAVGWLFYKNMYVSFLMAFLPAFFIKKYKLYLTETKRTRMNFEFQDVLYALSDSSAAGKQAAEGINAAYLSLYRIYGEKNPMTHEFKKMCTRIKEYNEAPEDVLMEFAVESGIEDIRNFVEIYSICIRSGGDKEKAIAKAVEITCEKIKLRRELSAVLAQKKIEAVILCSIPLAVLMILQLSSQDYAQVLYSSLAGKIIMTGCLIAGVAAGSMCLKIMDIKI